MDNNGNGSWTKTILPILLVLLLQTGAAFYWAGSLSARIEAIDMRLTKIETIIERQLDNRYRKADALEDFGKVADVIDKIETIIKDHEKRLDKIERGK